MKRPAASEVAVAAKKPTLEPLPALPLSALRSGLCGSYREQLAALEAAAAELMNHWDLWMLGAQQGATVG